MTDNDGSGAPLEAPSQTPRDRRRHKRATVNLPGRYMLEDGSEHPCVCVDISVRGVRLRAAVAGPWGSRVIAYIDGIGRIEGHIVRRAPGWFALETRITARKGERVQERIAAILDSQNQEGADRRRQSREPAQRAVSLSTTDGRRHAVEVTDISGEGAALLTDADFEIGERVRLESRRARIVRLFPGGVALKFENWTDETRLRREDVAVEARSTRARRA